MTRKTMAAALALIGVMTMGACAYTPAYEYIPTADSGDLSVDKASKECQFEVTKAVAGMTDLGAGMANAQSVRSACMVAKGFEERLVGDRNIYTGTVSPRS